MLEKKTYIPQNISFLRAKKKWSQEQLGEKIKKSKETINSYEKARSEPPLHVFLSLANIFEVSLEDFVYKDLSEGSVLKLQDPEVNYGSQLLQLTQQRVYELEREIREHAPELSKRLRLE